MIPPWHWSFSAGRGEQWMRSQGGQCKAWRICWPSKVDISTAITGHKITKIEKTRGLMVELHVTEMGRLLYNGPHNRDILQPLTLKEIIQLHNNKPPPFFTTNGWWSVMFVESGFAVNYPQVLSLQSLCFLFVWKPISLTKRRRLYPLCTGHMTNSRGCNSRCDWDNRPRATRTRLGHWQVIWEDLCVTFS